MLRVGDRLEHPMEQTFYTIVGIDDDGYVLTLDKSHPPKVKLKMSWALYDRLNWTAHTHIRDLVEIVCK